jgi:hypothetical protein
MKVVAWCKALSQSLPGGGGLANKRVKNLRDDSRCLGRDLNRAPSEFIVKSVTTWANLYRIGLLFSSSQYICIEINWT